MYTLMIQRVDGQQITSRQVESSIDLSKLNLDTIDEIWLADEAGNTVDHWQYEEDEDCENDGQPTEYEEWQDYMGGDDWDHGQYNDAY